MHSYLCNKLIYKFVTCLPFALYTGKDATAPTCIIIPLNPSFIPNDGGINNGTSNVMINCKCLNIDYQQIRWYSPDEEDIPFNYTETEDLPYVINGTLIIPIFNDSYQGTYYCRVGNDSVSVWNISLTLWTGVCVYVCVCVCVSVCARALVCMSVCVPHPHPVVKFIVQYTTVISSRITDTCDMICKNPT